MSKKYGEYTIADILRLRPKWFMEKQADLTLANKYLTQAHYMIDFGHSHIASYPFIDVFGDYNISAMPTSEFNKRIATYVPHVQERSPDVLSLSVGKLELIPREALTEALRTDKSSLEGEIENVADNIDSIESDMNSYCAQITDMQERIASSASRIQQLEETREHLQKRFEAPAGLEAWRLAMLRDIPQQWIVVRVSKQQFTVVRRTPITLKFSNAASGVCKTLYLGFMGFEFTWGLNLLSAFQCADFISTDSARLHPHVTRSNICWGNVGHRANEHIKNKDAGKFFALLESILTTYDPGNPYLKFTSLERQRNDNWVFVSPKLMRDHRSWWAGVESTLMAEWAKTASDRFVEMRAAGTPTATPVHTDGFAASVNLRYVNRMNEGITGFLDDIPMNGIRGKPLQELLKQHNIFIPSPTLLEKSGAMFTNLLTAVRDLMYLSYGIIENNGSSYAPSDTHMYFLRSISPNRYAYIPRFGESTSFTSSLYLGNHGHVREFDINLTTIPKAGQGVGEIAPF